MTRVREFGGSQVSDWHNNAANTFGLPNRTGAPMGIPSAPIYYSKTATSAWTRPADWPALPTLISTNQRFVALVAVKPSPNDSNRVTLAFTTSTGTYSVDWGDGTTTTAITSGTKVEKNYDYTTLGTSVTSEGFKTAIISVTPDTGNFTTVDLQQRHSAYTTGIASDTPWLDIAIAGTTITSIQISSLTSGSSINRTDQLRKVNIVSAGLTNASYLFANARKLVDITIGSLGAVTNVTSMFSGCWSLVTAPSFDTSAVTGTTTASGMSSMFANCYQLQSVPTYNTSNVVNMYAMFQNCRNLQTVPLLDTSKVTGTATGTTGGMNNMFDGCSSLQTVPLFDTSACIQMAFMFNNCYELQSVPLFNTGNVTGSATIASTGMNGMFTNCYSLTTVPQFNTSKVVNMASMFYGCYALTTVPWMNTSAVTGSNNAQTGMYQMFYNCVALQDVPHFNTTNVVNMSNMFFNCRRLKSVPLFNTVAVTGTTSASTGMGAMFSGCSALTTIPQFNTSNVVNMADMFFNCYNLQSVPLLDTSKVTGVNGTITGFSRMFAGCYSLKSVPLFNTALGVNMGAMFQDCFSLTTVPLFNTVSVTGTASSTTIDGMASMFSGCASLTNVPQFNTANVVNMYQTFYNCSSLQTVPLFNTANVTFMAGMFFGCGALTSVPLFDTTKVTSMASMFANCTVLQSVPVFNSAAVTDFSSMFANCNSLLSVPALNTSNGTTFTSMCSSCTMIKTLPAFDLTKATGISSIATSCPALETIACKPRIATTIGTMGSDASLSSAVWTGARVSLGFTSARLSGTALNALFTGLADIKAYTISTASWASNVATYTTSVNHFMVVGQSVTVTGITPTGYNITNAEVTAVTANTFSVAMAVNPTAYVSGGSIAAQAAATVTTTSCIGTGTMTTSIATNKGWTVV